MQEWAAEATVDETLARRLIESQFPEIDLRSVRSLGQGWDMTVWLVDDRWVFRFPRRESVIPGLRNEIAHLAALAPLLPLPIPTPLYLGTESPDYRWPFYGAPYLPGRELAEAGLDDARRDELAQPLAEFLRMLHGLKLDAELPLDPFRRADMSFRVPRTRERLAELEALSLWQPPQEARELVESALGLDPPQPIALVHGDLHLRHLLVDENERAAAVIDWIDLSYNDASVDLVLYWSLFTPRARDVFCETYGEITGEQLLRGRILALFLCGTLAVYGHHEGMPGLKREALAGLDRTMR